MKAIQNLKILLVLFSSFMFCSCEDFTEVDPPQTQLTGITVYQDEATATAALSDIYARMRENGVISGNVDGLSMLMGLYTDDLTYFGSVSSPMDSFYNHTIIPSNDYVSSLWSNGYSQIYASNAFLEGLSNSSDISGEIRNGLQGEALFIRGLLHFYLGNLYGDIPYITTTDYEVNSQVSRIPLVEVYNRIIGDLQEAKELLDFGYPVQERVRANKATVQALLARVYLYQGQWSMAEQEATDIINNNSLYDLESDLDAVFLKSSPSTIWQLHPGMAGLNTLEGRFFIFSSAPAIAAANNNLVDEFEDNDLRKQHWLKSVTDGSNIWYHSYKYKQNENTGVSQEYSIVFRLEEQYLIRAEARAQQVNITGAQEDLNKIRNRAGLGDTSATTKQDLLSAILQERRLELFTEIGHRWFDLKRTGQAGTILAPLKPAWQNRNLLLPIPETELILNSNLQPQNPGY
jgi:hypothetical protein